MMATATASAATAAYVVLPCDPDEFCFDAIAGVVGAGVAMKLGQSDGTTAPSAIAVSQYVDTDMWLRHARPVHAGDNVD